jgi:polar amino acid transport system substrate-binding protein
MMSGGLRTDLAPTGRLRIGINHGNPVLASKDPANGDLRGVAVDLARELGRRSELPVELVGFDAAGKMFEAVRAGGWDVAFLAIDPQRASEIDFEIDFTAAYLLIEGTYLVPSDSPYHSNEDIDHAGVRIGVSANSAYDLFLSRSIKHAQLVRGSGPELAFRLILDGKVDVVAGVRQSLAANAPKLPGSRVFGSRFMAIEQALGIPKGHDAAAKYLREFIEDVKASGVVAQAIERAGVGGVEVAPAAPIPLK